MEKVDYKHGTFIILESEGDFTYEDYVEYCEDNDLEPQGEESDDYYDWCMEESQANYDADLENIDNCKAYDVPVVVEGQLGLWWGRHAVKPVQCRCVYDAICKCIPNCDHYLMAKYEDGKIKVSVSHHDGTNCFIIRALSKKGQAKVGDDYKPHDFKRLPYLYAIGI